NEIKLWTDAGKEAAVGETGELFVRNAWLTAGYHRDAEATRASMREGYFSVGDLAHVDEHGLLHIDGRKRDMIISGGVNVYPAEVEEALNAHDAVAECAVIGVANEEWGEVVHAFVVVRPGRSVGEAELITHARTRLSNVKAPRVVRFVEQLPKNPTGKVLRNVLRGGL